MAILAQQMNHPDYKGEANDFLLALLDQNIIPKHPFLHLRHNWALWDGIMNSFPTHSHTDMTKKFLLLHGVEDFKENLGRYTYYTGAIGVVAEVIKEQEVSPTMAFHIFMKCTKQQEKLPILQACFQKLDAEHHLLALHRMAFIKPEMKKTLQERLSGGTFWEDEGEVKSMIVPFIHDYINDDQFVFYNSMLLVTLKDLYHYHPHLFVRFFEQGVPKVFQEKVFEPLVTRVLIEKKLSKNEKVAPSAKKKKM